MTKTDNKMTTKALASFTGRQAIASDNAAFDGTLSLIIWGVHNPGEYRQVTLGKTPKGFKAFRAQAVADSEGRDSKVRRMVTAAKVAGSILFGDADTSDKDFANACARLAISLQGKTILQALNDTTCADTGETILGLRSYVIATTKADSNSAMIDLGKAQAPEADASAESPVVTPEAEAEAEAEDTLPDVAPVAMPSMIKDMIAAMQTAIEHGQGAAMATASMREEVVRLIMGDASDAAKGRVAESFIANVSTKVLTSESVLREAEKAQAKADRLAKKTASTANAAPTSQAA